MTYRVYLVFRSCIIAKYASKVDYNRMSNQIYWIITDNNWQQLRNKSKNIEAEATPHYFKEFREDLIELYTVLR